MLSVPQPSGVHEETQQLAFSALKRKKAQDRKVFDEQEKMNGLAMPAVPLRIKLAKVAKKAIKASRCAKSASSTAGSKVAVEAMTGNALVGGHGKPVMSTRESRAQAKTALTKWAEKKSASGTKPADKSLVPAPAMDAVSAWVRQFGVCA